MVNVTTQNIGMAQDGEMFPTQQCISTETRRISDNVILGNPSCVYFKVEEIAIKNKALWVSKEVTVTKAIFRFIFHDNFLKKANFTGINFDIIFEFDLARKSMDNNHLIIPYKA